MLFYYDVTGGGEAVVLLHAGICDSRMWAAQVPVLAKHFQVYRYDMRGYGRTPLTDITYAHHDDLLALLHHWQIDAAHLVGASKGGHSCHGFCPAASGARTQPDYGWQPSQRLYFRRRGATHLERIGGSLPGGRRSQNGRIGGAVDGWQFRPVGSAPTPVRDRVLEMDSIALANEMKDIGKEVQPDPKAAGRLSSLRGPLLAIAGDCDDANM